MKNTLDDFVKRRAGIAKELRSLSAEEEKLLAERKTIGPELDKIKIAFSERSPDMSLDEYQALEQKQTFYLEHDKKLLKSIRDLQSTRASLSINIAVLHRQILNALIEKDGEFLREKFLDTFVRLQAYAKLQGGIAFDLLLIQIFRLNDPHMRQRIKDLSIEINRKLEAGELT